MGAAVKGGGGAMVGLNEFERYMDLLYERLGYADCRLGFVEYSRGLMLPIEGKSVEPLAAHVDPWRVSAKHQSLHHMVAKSDWSDEVMLEGVREWVTPTLGLEKGCYWIVDDTGFPKNGRHSVGVAANTAGSWANKIGPKKAGRSRGAHQPHRAVRLATPALVHWHQ